jgi:hypothetical protein
MNAKEEWLIMCFLEDDDMYMFWNKEHGWGNLENATGFVEKDQPAVADFWIQRMYANELIEVS